MAPPLKVHVLHLDSRLEVRQPSLEVSMLPLSHGAAPRGPMAPPSRSELLYPSRSYGVANLHYAHSGFWPIFAQKCFGLSRGKSLV